MKKLNHNGFGHLVIILLVVTAAVIGAVGWQVSTRSPRPPAAVQPNSTASPPPASAAPSNAKAVTAAMTTALSVKFTNDGSSPGNIVGAGHIRIMPDNFSPFWQPTGYNFYVSPDTGSSLNIAYDVSGAGLNSPDAQTIYGILHKQLFAAGLRLSSSSNVLQSSLNGASIYRNSTTLCALPVPGSDPISISCADFSSYPPAAEKVKPFADAYFAKNPQQVNKTGFQMPQVQTSHSPGYMTASMDINESVGWFYEKNGTWTFWTQGQMSPSCQDYQQNPDVRLAFLGTSCLSASASGGTQSTVQ